MSFQQGVLEDMKQCNNCYAYNQDLMNFCSQCGAAFQAFSGNNYSNTQRTAAYPTETPTAVNARRLQNNNQYQNQFAPVTPPPSRTGNLNKVLVIFGSLLVLFFLITGVGAATAYRAYIKNQKAKTTEISSLRDKESDKTNPVNNDSNKDKDSDKTNTNSDPVKNDNSGNSNRINENDRNSNTTKKTDTTRKTNASAKYYKTWVDYNVTEDGRTGMRIHVKFAVSNMKDENAYLAVYFEKENGTKLTTNNLKYSSKSGQVAVFRQLKPSYDETIYDDVELFMPYEELNLGVGEYNLKMDVDVIYEDGGLVKHLDYYGFWYKESIKRSN